MNSLSLELVKKIEKDLIRIEIFITKINIITLTKITLRRITLRKITLRKITEIKVEISYDFILINHFY